jgi:hypothetical protein
VTSPPDAERRPGRSGVQKTAAKQSESTIAQPADDLADLALGYQVGYGNAYQVAYAHGVADESAAWTAIFTGCAATWRRPNYAELEQRRTFDWQPCPRRCRACSRCIASEAYWRRGGKPYGGIQAVAS